MIYKIILILTSVYGIYQLFRATDPFAKTILLGQIIAIALPLTQNQTEITLGLLLFMLSLFLIITYGLTIKKLSSSKRALIIIPSSLLFITYLFEFQDYPGSGILNLALFLSIISYVIALTTDFKNYKNELGFLTIIVIVACSKLLGLVVSERQAMTFSNHLLLENREPVNVISNDQSEKQTGKLQAINYSDAQYIDLLTSTLDTITTDGYEIKYLVRDDSTKYSDIYIQCSKGKQSGVFQGKNLLEYRRYFIPKFIGESASHLYFSHGCATDCSALLVFPKDSLSTFREFSHIVDFSMEHEQILFVSDSTYKNENKLYDLVLVNLRKDKTQHVTYNNLCGAVYKPACIDTVIFNKNHVTIKTTLRENIKLEKMIQQTRQIKL